MADFQGDDALFGPEHVRTYRETNGEHGYNWRGTEVLLLTTTGRKSGEEHTTPLIHRRDGDRFVIIASKGGAPTHPAWYHNLRAHPEVTLEVGREKFRARASVATDAERRRLYDKHAERMPAFWDYEKKTTRRIPVVVLDRI